MGRRGCWLVIVLAAGLGSVWGQSSVRGPHIGYAYPAGGKQGTVFRVAVGGQFLRGTADVYISGQGVRASVVDYIRPLNNNELSDVAWYLRQLVRRRWSARVMAELQKSEDPPTLPNHPWLRDLDEKSAGELGQLRANLFDPKKQMNAQIADQVEIEVTIDPKAAPGDRELRLVTPTGLTNSLCFQVDTMPEAREQYPNDTVASAVAPLNLPVVLNGQITPGDVDCFRLRAKRGQKLVFQTQARYLMPYLADAVPGWFQPALTLYDAQGKEVAFIENYRSDPDPILFYEVPQDGDYILEVRDVIYRGREDFVYRVRVGELPFITQWFPLGGQAGVATRASVDGWNLPWKSVSLDTRPGGDAYRQASWAVGGLMSNTIPYAVDTLPEITETEPNNTTRPAQSVSLPVIVNGRIAQPGDCDVFAVQGQSGDEIVAEAYARRLGSPLDSLLRLLDATGAVLAWNDDTPDKAFGLIAHQADSYLKFRLPQAGTYFVQISDVQQHGGDDYAYRLRLSPPRPDFALRVIPPAVNMARGGSAQVTVQAIRKDGFNGDIDLTLKNAPVGFTLSKGRIPSGGDTAKVTLSSPRGVSQQISAWQIEGQAKIGDAQISRPAVAAEDMMQAFAYRHLVPQQELMLAVAGARPVPAVWRPLVPGLQVVSASPLRIPQGSTTLLQIKAPQILPDPRHSSLQALRFRLSNLPRGVTVRQATVTPTGVNLTVKADAYIAQVGDTANLIIEVFVETENKPANDPTAARKQLISIGVLPAIPFQIVQMDL